MLIDSYILYETNYQGLVHTYDVIYHLLKIIKLVHTTHM